MYVFRMVRNLRWIDVNSQAPLFGKEFPYWIVPFFWQSVYYYLYLNVYASAIYTCRDTWIIRLSSKTLGGKYIKILGNIKNVFFQVQPIGSLSDPKEPSHQYKLWLRLIVMSVKVPQYEPYVGYVHSHSRKKNTLKE